MALYEAKRSGRNRVAGPGVEEPAEMGSLRTALGEAAYALGTARLERLAGDLDSVVLALRLSAEERTDLEALVVASAAWESYSEALRDEPALSHYIGPLDALARSHRAEAPETLLTRVLQALLAPPDVDPDPEIEAMVERLRGG